MQMKKPMKSIEGKVEKEIRLVRPLHSLFLLVLLPTAKRLGMHQPSVALQPAGQAD